MQDETRERLRRQVAGAIDEHGPGIVNVSDQIHKHPEIEQTWVLEGSFSDHEGIAHAGEFVWRTPGSVHETYSEEGAIILAVYRKPNVFQKSSGFRARRARGT